MSKKKPPPPVFTEAAEDIRRTFFEASAGMSGADYGSRMDSSRALTNGLMM